MTALKLLTAAFAAIWGRLSSHSKHGRRRAVRSDLAASPVAIFAGAWQFILVITGSSDGTFGLDRLTASELATFLLMPGIRVRRRTSFSFLTEGQGEYVADRQHDDSVVLHAPGRVGCPARVKSRMSAGAARRLGQSLREAVAAATPQDTTAPALVRNPV